MRVRPSARRVSPSAANPFLGLALFAAAALLLGSAQKRIERADDIPAGEPPRRGKPADDAHPFARGRKAQREELSQSPAAMVFEGGDRGRHANAPAEISATGWKDIALRTYRSVSSDRVLALSAGVTYYILLSLFPALAALVSIFGLMGDAGELAARLSLLAGLVPGAVLDIIRQQLQTLTAQGNAALGFAFLFSLGTSLWTAQAAIKALFDALNVVYGEQERRGFVKLSALSLLFTAGLLVFVTLAVGAVIVLPTLLNFILLGSTAEWAMRILRWPALYALVLIGLSIVYRYGPSRSDAKWRWVTWGSGFAALVWMVASMGFSWYVENFDSYNKTYGSLGAIIAFMVWSWLSIVVVLMGGELNAEMEHQTARDTTTGAPAPLGARGARMADTIGAAQG